MCKVNISNRWRSSTWAEGASQGERKPKTYRILLEHRRIKLLLLLLAPCSSAEILSCCAEKRVDLVEKGFGGVLAGKEEDNVTSRAASRRRG